MSRLAEEGSSDEVKNGEVMAMDKEERVSNVGEEDMSVEEVEEVERVSQQKKGKGSGVLTDVPFTSLGLSEPTLKTLNERGFHTMTKIQCDAIPPLLSGKDLFRAARTGSGKTLAFLIPAAELLHKLNSSSGREKCHCCMPYKRACNSDSFGGSSTFEISTFTKLWVDYGSGIKNC